MLASTTAKALGATAVALIVVGATVGLLFLIFGGRKGYQYYKLSGNKKKSVIKDNPMYHDGANAKSANPLYQGE